MHSFMWGPFSEFYTLFFFFFGLPLLVLNCYWFVIHMSIHIYTFFEIIFMIPSLSHLHESFRLSLSNSIKNSSNIYWDRTWIKAHALIKKSIISPYNFFLMFVENFLKSRVKYLIHILKTYPWVVSFFKSWRKLFRIYSLPLVFRNTFFSCVMTLYPENFI